MSLPTLYIRGNLVIPKNVSPSVKQTMEDAVPVQYIVNFINNAVATNAGSKVLILKSGTGSGKSTSLPMSLYPKYGHKKIAVTEPQRLNCEEISTTIQNVDPTFILGENIGFHTGLINRVPKRGIVFMTTGILVQKLINQLITEPDKFMRQYSIVIVDEVHKHDIMTDVLLRLLKQLLDKHWNNPECPFIILQSATLNENKYMEYFDTTNFIEVSGITHPISVNWPKTSIANLPEHIVKICKEIHGDTLVFLPTAKSISAVKSLLEKTGKKIIEIMGKDITKGEIKQMAQKSKYDRIILSSNVAETGVTIKYLNNVIDTGLVNNVQFNPQYNCTSISLNPVSKSSAIQRRGRVGRTAPGNWYPLFTEDTFNKLIESNPPEIYVSDNSAYMLRLIVSLTESTLDDHWKVESRLVFDPATIGLIHNPSHESLCSSYEKLYQLGFIKSNWTPTVTGVLAAKMPKTSLEVSKMLFSAPYFKADIYKLIIIAACVEEGGLGKLELGTELFAEHVRCDFISNLLAFEHLQRKIKKMTVKHMSLNFISDWCSSVGINYESALRVIEKVYELTFQLMELGIRVNVDTIPLLDSLENEEYDEIITIKSCIMEGFRLNTCTFNDNMQSYVSDYKHNLCSAKYLNTNALNITTDSIMYIGGSFSVGKFICQLDEHVIVDTHYMY